MIVIAKARADDLSGNVAVLSVARAVAPEDFRGLLELVVLVVVVVAVVPSMIAAGFVLVDAIKSAR